MILALILAAHLMVAAPRYDLVPRMLPQTAWTEVEPLRRRASRRLRRLREKGWSVDGPLRGAQLW